jgi:glycosyltransferase involved in cell wall biosynthesis
LWPGDKTPVEGTNERPGAFQFEMTGPFSSTNAVLRRPRPAATRSQPVPSSLHVLHVVEALGSGIATALEDYVRSTPQHTHTVLAYRRPWAQTGDQLERLAARVLPLPEGRLAQVRAVRHWVRALGPDVVHAHSTYAGVYVRLFARPTGASPVYTPHAYPFERRDVPGAVRGLYWLVEAGLSIGGGCVAAVGPHEAELAARLPGRQAVVQLPNVVRDLRPRPTGGGGRAENGGGLQLAMVGRISPQKGWDFFAEAVRRSHASGLPLHWTWVGGGAPDQEAALLRAGAQVTGWLPRQAALDRLAAADVYVHTAAWEGFPVSLLEAAALGLPVVARRIPALEALEVPALCDTPEALVTAARSLLDPTVRAATVDRSRLLVERHRPEAQRAALETAYAIALGGTAAPATGRP